MELNTYTPSRPEFKVYSGTAELPQSHIRRIQRFAGGATGDRMVIELARDQALVDSGVLFETQQIEIYQTRETGGGSTSKRIFWGFVAGLTHSLATERITFEVRVARFHLGKPLDGMDERQRVASEQRVATLEEDLVFNPLVDEIIRGNMRGDAADGPGSRALFVDPDSLRTSRARTFQQVPWIDDEEFTAAADELKWTLAKAVHYLCWTLNAATTYIDNPSLGELEELFGTASSDLRDVRIPLGRYLSEALDQVLKPLGYGWFIHYGGERPSLKFFGRGRGQAKAVTLAKPQTPFSWNNDLKRSGLAVGYQSLVNEVTVLGGFEEIECTIELWPAWDKKYDVLGDEGEVTEDDLAKGSDRYEADPEVRRVCRDFVFNEDGSYNGLRPGLTAPADLSAIFGVHMTARRRRLYPCITLSGDKAPIGQEGIIVEWLLGERPTNPTLQQLSLETGDWRPLDELEYGSIHVLRNEIGIRFDGQYPPDDVLNDPKRFRLKVTATLRSDRRLRATAYRSASSPQALKVAELIKADDSFRYRYIGAKSKFFSASLISKLPSGDKLANDAVDDTEAIGAYAERLRYAWDQADASGTLTVALLDGVEYELGDVITGIAGRGISFAAGGDGTRYPQVTAIEYDFDAQERILTIATMRDAGGA